MNCVLYAVYLNEAIILKKENKLIFFNASEIKMFSQVNLNIFSRLQMTAEKVGRGQTCTTRNDKEVLQAEGK